MNDDDLLIRPRRGGFFMTLFVSLFVSVGVYFAMRELVPPKSPQTAAASAAVDVPSVLGMPVAQAREALDSKSLLLTLDAERDDPAPAGTIIAQSPLQGSRALRDSAVHATLSRGQIRVKVPDLVGKAADQAAPVLAEAKLVAAAVEPEASATVAAGTILSTTPSAGTEVAPGTEVKLTVSAGAGTVEVPKVTAIQLKRAKELIQAAKLAVAVKTTYDEDRGPYVVLKQDPAAGSKVAPGSTVNLLVNEGE